MIHHTERKVSIKEHPTSELQTILVGNTATIKRIRKTRSGPLYNKVIERLQVISNDIYLELISRN